MSGVFFVGFPQQNSLERLRRRSNKVELYFSRIVTTRSCYGYVRIMLEGERGGVHGGEGGEMGEGERRGTE